MTPEERYEALIDDLLPSEGVTPPEGGSGFGRGAVRYHSKIFAMFVRGQLVVKLPAARVGELVAAGHGARFDANKGTPMKEWFTLDAGSQLSWPDLAREALDFARSNQGRANGVLSSEIGSGGNDDSYATGGDGECGGVRGPARGWLCQFV